MPGNVDNKLIYHLGVLIPFWVLELLGELVVIAGGAIGLSAWLYVANNTSCYYDDYGDYTCSQTFDNSALDLGYGAFGGALGLGIVFLILHIIQIALFGRRKLTPAANFGFELPRLVIWTAIFILEIIAFQYGSTSILALAFAILLWALYLGSTIYSIVIFHRARRGAYNGSSTNYGAHVAYSAPAAYPAQETQQSAAQAQQHYGPGPYQAPGTQQHYGPGPYQHPSETHQQNQYQQSGYTTSHGPISSISSPQPMYGQSTYPPPQQQGLSEKEMANQKYQA